MESDSGSNPCYSSSSSSSSSSEEGTTGFVTTADPDCICSTFVSWSDSDSDDDDNAVFAAKMNENEIAEGIEGMIGDGEEEKKEEQEQEEGEEEEVDIHVSFTNNALYNIWGIVG